MVVRINGSPADVGLGNGVGIRLTGAAPGECSTPRSPSSHAPHLITSSAFDGDIIYHLYLMTLDGNVPGQITPDEVSDHKPSNAW